MKGPAQRLAGPIATLRSIATAFVLAAVLTSPLTALDEPLKLERSQPAEGEVLNERPESVRLWFSETVDPRISELTITGPGEVELTHMHRMGMVDLMAAFEGEAPDGEYTIHWTTAGADRELQSGTVTFELRAESDGDN